MKWSKIGKLFILQLEDISNTHHPWFSVSANSDTCWRKVYNAVWQMTLTHRTHVLFVSCDSPSKHSIIKPNDSMSPNTMFFNLGLI